MTGRVLKLVVFLLLGAVVNVAVAWGCAVHDQWWLAEANRKSEVPEYIDSWSRRYQVMHNGWRLLVDERPGSVGVIWVHGICEEHHYPEVPVRKRAPAWSFANRLPSLPEEEIKMVYVKLHGWPLATLGYTPIDETERTDFQSWRILGWTMPLTAALSRFLINTLFYAVSFWLLWATPFATRRLIRKRSGRCVKCGYDLRGTEHDVCPECGAIPRVRAR